MTAVDDFADPILSAEQQAAVDSDAPALVVVASAGSGKTEVVARRIQRLLLAEPEQGKRVLALTYTVKAADELRGRLSARLGVHASRVDSDTLHGFAHALLRTHGTRIGLPLEPELLTRDEDRVELLRAWLTDRGEPEPVEPRELLASFDLARARRQVVEGLEQWKQALDDSGSLDYPALLEKATELLQVASVNRQVRRLYKSVVVDEAQNITQAQFELLVSLAGTSTDGSVPMMLVGDDKQSIVSFAGADPALMSKFAVMFNAERHELHTNFRSATVLAQAAITVATVLERGPAPLASVAYAAEGEIAIEAHPSEVQEAQRIADWVTGLLTYGIPASALGPNEKPSLRAEDIAVLSRTASGLRHTAAAFEARGIPFASSSTPSEWLGTIAAKVIFELVGVRGAPEHRSTFWELRRLLGPSLHADSEQAIHDAMAASPDPLVRAAIGVLALNDVTELAAFLGQMPIPASLDDSEAANWQADVRQLSTAWRQFDGSTARSELTWTNFRLHCARAQRGDDLAPGVRLSTVHKAQGREYVAVAVVGLTDGQFPDFRATSDAALRDELRTFYVAVTRPRRLLLLTHSTVRETRYGPRNTQPSRFLSLVVPP